jgi:hypothetical protein
MLKYLALGACLTCAFGPAAAEDGVTFFMFGWGLKSCAYWQALPATRDAGEWWIIGFWSGLNRFNENHMVGSKTDYNGIIAEVKKVCAGRPSMSVSDATLTAYKMLAQEK